MYCRDNRREIAVIAEIREPEGTTDKKTQKYPYIHRHQVLYLSNLVDRRVHADDEVAFMQKRIGRVCGLNHVTGMNLSRVNARLAG